MFKTSNPGDRKFILHELPVLMTELEMAMPQTWNTAVVHIFTFHTVAILMSSGPFCVSNMFKVSAPTHTHIYDLKFR
jgi:hypothetical protein